ncbi:UNVERIFIED_CONTAM: U-box domain-containing protein 5 [Sesamum radiatum]|uniref:RING-type E3 ubiquitin transferase n=1 Tax=Sesamum radiatum TaxID=300843 RepID=A0AAW2VPR6_SESRA
MGNHVAEVMEGLPSARTIKVHAQMCSELLKVVVKVSKVFPEIEAARPRCSSGLEALCLLNNGIAKAKSLLQHCSESGALYLALTGDAILSRCKKSRNLLEQSLSQIQNMVPVMLAAKISGIIADLRSAGFWLDPSEEEAGRVLRELLHRYGSAIGSTEEALAAVHTVSSLLHISSEKALLIERRSIRKLLEKFGESEPSKRKILLFFLNLLNKYGKVIVKKPKHNGSSEHEDLCTFERPYDLSGEVELRANYRSNAQIDMLSRPVPPLEFICPLSSRLMYDPVVIASGQTYERMWIQKWFDEGHDTCPKTNRKLNHLSLTSNTGMKDLITRWCSMHGVSIPDPEIQQTLVKSLETSMNSIASLSNSMNDLYLPLDLSNTSLGSSQGSDLYKNIGDNEKPSHQIDMEEFSRLPWDSQCIAVEDVKKLLKHNDESWSVIPSEKFIPLILGFLKDAHDLHDVEAQMTGCLLLFEFVHKNRSSISYMKEDAYDLLASFLDTEVSKQALAILEELSFDQHCGHRIAASGAFIGILNILDSRIQELLEPALKILCNLSSTGGVDSFMVPSMFIPKLVPLFEDNTLARYCITILKNLCHNEDCRMSVAETDGCIASISKLLEKDSHEDQEHAVSVLLSLCSQRPEYCQLVMDEGVIPGLVSVSINGNKKAKAMALEILRILKEELNARGESSRADVSTDSTKQQKDKNPPKAPGLFRELFSKPSALAARKKK